MTRFNGQAYRIIAFLTSNINNTVVNMEVRHRLGKTHNSRAFRLAWVEVNERDGNKNTNQVLLLLFHPSHDLAVFFRQTFKVHGGNVYVFVSFSRVWGACWSRNHRARPIQASSIPAVAIKVILFKPRSRLFQCF